MKKYYEKPFVMLLDIPGTNQIAMSTEPTPTTWICDIDSDDPIEDAQEYWSRKTSSIGPDGNPIGCSEKFWGYTHFK